MLLMLSCTSTGSSPTESYKNFTLFDKEVKVTTGPLVCETESTLEGISKVITTLTDTLCPTAFTNKVSYISWFLDAFNYASMKKIYVLN